MKKTTHVRAALADILELVEMTLAAQGFVRSLVELEPRVVELGGETITLAPELPPNVRRVTVAEKDGWVAIADDPFASTDWGARLSEMMEDVPVLTLEGECDHAFYSYVVVHENGDETHRSEVPRDAVHEPDGRHRIRPTFLGAYFPNAKATLEQGIVVNRLGGEENIHAVAEVLSLPNALLSTYDGEGEGRVSLLFEYDAERAPAEPAVEAGGAFAAMFGELAAELGQHLDPEMLASMGLAAGADPAAVAQAMLGQLGSLLTNPATSERPLALEARHSSRESGFAGDEHQCHTTFSLEGGPPDGLRRARGATVRLSGAGLAHYAVEKIHVVPANAVGDEAKTRKVTPERDGDALIAAFPDVELSLASAAPPAATLPADERMRRKLHTPFQAVWAQNTAELVVYLVGKLGEPGAGPIAIEASVTAEDGTELRALSKNTLVVEPALRTPVLPDWVDESSRRQSRHVLSDYGGDAFCRGWIAFDRDWADVREAVRRMAVDLGALLLEIVRSEPRVERVELDGKAKMHEIREALERGAEVIVRGKGMPMRAVLDDSASDSICMTSFEEEPPAEAGFGADVLRKGGERLAFPVPVDVGASPVADAPWGRILAELERGADVSLRAGAYDSGITVEISHQPEGSNHFPDEAKRERHPRVQLAWSCPRPKNAGSARSLARIAFDLLTRAGNIRGNIGGVVFVAGSASHLPTFTTPYESLVGTRSNAGVPSTLRAHVRSPGHCVLVPEGALAKLPKAAGVDVRRLEHGALLTAAGDDPFTADREPMERAVLPLLCRPDRDGS